MTDSSEQNRSEEATSYKLIRARKKGAVARGADLAFLTGMAAFFGYASFMGPAARDQIATAGRRALIAASNVTGDPNALFIVTGSLMSAAVRPICFMAATIFAVVLAFEVVQTGLVFSSEPFKIDFNRLSPAQNFKRMISVRLLIETGKTLLKLVVYSSLAYMVLREARTITLSSITDAPSLARAMIGAALRLMMFFLAAAAFIAVLDQLIVRRDFLKKMRMSRREVRRESRDREGDPRLKQRRRQLHAEYVKISESVRNVKGADVLITNPTHYAVALRYDPRTMAAPTVVARGSHQIAQRLKRLAFTYGVVIVENKALARALYQRSQLNQEISETYYRGVADIYQQMRAKTAGVRGR